MNSLICTVVFVVAGSICQPDTQTKVLKRSSRQYEINENKGFQFYDNVNNNKKVYGEWPNSFEKHTRSLPEKTYKDENYSETHSENNGAFSENSVAWAREDRFLETKANTVRSRLQNLMVKFGLAGRSLKMSMENIILPIFPPQFRTVVQDNEVKKTLANGAETMRIIFFTLFSIFQGLRDLFKVFYYFGIYLNDPANFDLLATIGEFNILYVP